MTALIIVPFALFGESMDAWSETVLQALSERPVASFALVVALLASDVLLPIPSSIVSTLAGAVLGLAAGATASFAGMTLGCFIGHGIGRTAGKDVARRLIGQRELERLQAGASRHGDWSVVAARAVPVLAEASTLFAGIGSMRLSRFMKLTALSNLGISLAYAGVGALAAEVQSFLVAVAGAVLVPILVSAALRRPVPGSQPPQVTVSD
ncbi:MAG: TVP38/TMEM64 family protein [Planctomycetota bacterium]